MLQYRNVLTRDFQIPGMTQYTQPRGKDNRVKINIKLLDMWCVARFATICTIYKT